MAIRTPAARLSLAAATGERATGRQAWMLLWRSSHRLAVLVVAQAVVSALTPALVVAALGVIVGRVPAAIESGLHSSAGHRLESALVVAGGLYALSLVLDPIEGALSTAARVRITGALQGRLLRAVNAPVGVAHLEDTAVLDRLARAEGTLTGFFPGDAPITWVGSVSSRVAGLVGCAVVATFSWWLALILASVWIVVRLVMVRTVVRQVTELRGQTTAMRRAWYFTGVGSKARDAKEIRVFGLATFVGERFRGHYLTALESGAEGLRRVHLRALACWFAVAAAYALSVWRIAEATRQHEISLGHLAILLPMLAVTMQLGSVGTDDLTLAWTLAGLPDVDRLESDLTADARLAGTLPLDGQPRTAVRFEAVSFRYPVGDRDVLDHLDLELRAGSSTAIVGVNGAGKSTLVSLLSRLRDPTSGRITVDGNDIRDIQPDAWQRLVALMPQEPVRYPMSAYDNVAFGALAFHDDRDGVLDAARLAGFLDVVDHLPSGWETVLTGQLPGGAELSGGQWQRLALARALFATRHGARILVLDEPTAALDVRSEAQFYDRFLQITRDLTTVVISHRFATVRRADTICVLDGGRITERGSHDQLVAAAGTYASAYRLQARRFGGQA